MPPAHAPAAKFEGHLLCILNGRKTDAPECAPSPPVERGKVARFLRAANTHHLNCRAWERQLLRTGQRAHPTDCYRIFAAPVGLSPTFPYPKLALPPDER